MKYHVQISPQALDEAEEGYLWIRENAPLAAARWYGRLMQAIDSLERNPEVIRWLLKLRRLLWNSGKCFSGKDRGSIESLFTIHGNVVRVHHIRHGAQKFLEPPEKKID